MPLLYDIGGGSRYIYGGAYFANDNMYFCATPGISRGARTRIYEYVFSRRLLFHLTLARNFGGAAANPLYVYMYICAVVARSLCMAFIIWQE